MLSEHIRCAASNGGSIRSSFTGGQFTWAVRFEAFCHASRTTKFILLPEHRPLVWPIYPSLSAAMTAEARPAAARPAVLPYARACARERCAGKPGLDSRGALTWQGDVRVGGKADIDGTEIPQCSGRLPRCVLRSGGSTVRGRSAYRDSEQFRSAPRTGRPPCCRLRMPWSAHWEVVAWST